MSISKSINNIAFICKVEYVKISDVDTFVKRGSTELIVTLKTGKLWQEIYGSPASKQLSSNFEVLPSGDLFTHSLNLFYPGNEKASVEEILRLKKVPLMVRISYSDSSVIILGLPEEPTFMTSIFDSTTRTGYSCNFKCLSIESFRFESV